MPESLIRILIIDDHLASLAALEALLLDEGYVVDPASSGSAGMILAEANPPDILITELNTPGMIGLRPWHDLSPDLPVIVVTGVDTSATMEALRAGTEDYVTKPVDFSALLLCIERATHARRPAALRRRGDDCSARSGDWH